MLQFTIKYTAVDSFGNYQTFHVADFALTIDACHFIPRILGMPNTVEVIVINNSIGYNFSERVVRKFDDMRSVSNLMLDNQKVFIEPYDAKEHGEYHGV